MATINLSVSTSLGLRQFQSVPVGAERVVSFLILAQKVHCSLVPLNSSQPLTIAQVAHPALNLHIAIRQGLGLAQVAPKNTLYLAVNNVLLLQQQGASVNLQYTQNVLHIGQVALPSRALLSILVPTQVVLPTLIIGRPTTQTLTLASVAVYFKTDAVNTFNIPVPDTILPVGVSYTNGTLILNLKAPELGNGDMIEFLRIQRETRGGDLQIFSDPVWPIIETLKWTFKNVKRIDAIRTIQFLEQTVGQELTMLDYEGNTWTGIISTPAPDVKCMSDMNCGSYEFSIDFQGVLE